MARVKIQIKRIENKTKRQIVYSRRRKGLFKMARDLDALCDDHKISVIMISNDVKIHEYTSPSSTTTKELIDLYQMTRGIDIWSSHYERMEEKLKVLKETNQSLRKQISQMMGKCLSDLSFKELLALDEEMGIALETLRERKFMKIRCQVAISKKKIKHLEEMKDLLTNFDVMDEPDHGVVDNGGVYDHGIRRPFAPDVQPNQPIVTETKSVLTTCSISGCSVNQPDIDDETESVHVSS